MVNTSFVKCITIAILAFGICERCHAQKKPTRSEIINYVLSDTLNQEIYLIPLTFKFENSDTLWIGYSSALELYQYCRTKYGWSTDVFINKMHPILSHDKTFEIDRGFISEKQFILKSECDCLFNENFDELEKRMLQKNYYPYPDERFACFVYKCMKNKIALAWIEGLLVYLKHSAIRDSP